MKTQISSILTVSHREAGQGIPLVFLHAFPLSSAMWQAQLDEFSRNFRVLAPDVRGIGESSRFEVEMSIELLARDVALWLEEIGIYEPIALCGLSMGGYVALEFARIFPQKLAALILADTRADADSPEAKTARDEMIEYAKAHDGRAVAQKMLPKLLGETTLRQNPEIAHKVNQIAAPNRGENLAQLIAALRDRRDSTDILASISVPTLVIGGAQDVVSPPDVMAQMAAQIPGARGVVIEDAGHLSNLEQPDEFNAALREFLSSVA
jgi:pimeloyl-ACP methyl ester carboxylesterase